MRRDAVRVQAVGQARVIAPALGQVAVLVVEPVVELVVERAQVQGPARVSGQAKERARAAARVQVTVPVQEQEQVPAPAAGQGRAEGSGKARWRAGWPG